MAASKRARVDDAPLDEIVRLSVGGTPFTTLRSTLCNAPGSMLAVKFSTDSGFAGELKDELGAYFIDADPTLFPWLLNYLRRGCQLGSFPPDDIISSVRLEAEYFGLVDMVAALDAKINPAEVEEPIAEAVQFCGGETMRMVPPAGLKFHDVVIEACRSVFVRTEEEADGAPVYEARPSGFEFVLRRYTYPNGLVKWMVSDRSDTGTDMCKMFCQSDAMSADKITGVWNLHTFRVDDGTISEQRLSVPEVHLRKVPKPTETPRVAEVVAAEA